MYTIQQIDKLKKEIQSKITIQPRVAIILGTGLGQLADSIERPDVIAYSDLTNWPVSTVQGHAGRLVAGKMEGQPVIVMQGRVHFYEGYNMAEVTMPVRVFQRIGIEILIVTNAAGAINPDFLPGDVMLITDHINLTGMTGLNPLIGPNFEEFGPRFPDMSQAYDRDLASMARTVADIKDISIHEGVYAGLSGPSFETPADLRFLRVIGADAVGMSTVPEVTVARHGGTRVLGFSGISNKANLDGNTLTTHDEVLDAGKILGPKIEGLIRGILNDLRRPIDAGD